jgi:hypothetical protein
MFMTLHVCVKRERERERERERKRNILDGRIKNKELNNG